MSAHDDSDYSDDTLQGLGCTLEELKESVDRGYRRFWRVRGLPAPDEGFRVKAAAGWREDKERKRARERAGESTAANEKG